ncbi:MAG: dihydrofolate reductase [Hyphomicrobiaceae bacterium]|nr:dihydrofolate reductase [Hyphomicrobiaceae bacterium]
MADKDVRVAFVVAVADNGVIGKGGKLPWRLSSDLKFFRNATMNRPLIMGRKTFESIGKPLDGRDNIVITRTSGFSRPGIHVFSDLEAALQMAREKAAARGTNEITVIGGAEIYALTLPVADIIYLTEVHAEPEGDTFFPDIDREEWREISRERHSAGPKDSADYSFVVLERTQH